MVALAAALLVSVPAAGRAQSPPMVPVADHHLHIQGPEVSALLLRVRARMPAAFAVMDEAVFAQRTGADALRMLDSAGTRQGVLLSEAYMFASPLVAADRLDVVPLTRAENRYSVETARASDGRLVACIAVNPLASSALAEIAYWREAGGAACLKLHLGNSGVDLMARSQVGAVRDVVAAARQAGLGIVVHLRGSPAYGAAQARAFIRDILPAAQGVAVQVAHGAGWGGLDDSTLVALAAFGRAIAAGVPGTDWLVIDLSLVVLDERTDPALAQRLAGLMREIGLTRFVIGSDWPARYAPKQHMALLMSQVPLTPAEWSVVAANRAAYLR